MKAIKKTYPTGFLCEAGFGSPEDKNGMSLDQQSIYIYILYFVSSYRLAPFGSLEEETVRGQTI